MSFEWDPEKARLNLAKHGVSFEFATRVWHDPNYALLLDRVVDGEQRWHAIGLVDGTMILLVVHTYPAGDDEDHVRIISARKATPSETRRYGR
ncbi:MAG: BrnT family toxin [Caulobacter sp.]|nr:BrnT family toxin [Caulobacter sp.]